jgi:hypothetical protein
MGQAHRRNGTQQADLASVETGCSRARAFENVARR